MLTLCACGSGISGHGSESQIDDPSLDNRDDRSEAIGFYSDGSLRDAFPLPDESPSHLKIFRPRDRAWGTWALVTTIVRATAAFRTKYPIGDRVQIGDLSAEHGGGIDDLHASHQNGLDADVAYLRVNHLERDPTERGERGFEERFVQKKVLTKNFDLVRNWFLLREIVAVGNVSRIFVDPAIKRTFCRRSAELDPAATDAFRAEVLRRLRPYPDHDDHFHMRVKCPRNSPRCVAQEEPPAGSGCDSMNSAQPIDPHEFEGTPS